MIPNILTIPKISGGHILECKFTPLGYIAWLKIELEQGKDSITFETPINLDYDGGVLIVSKGVTS
jgi:hypothetical protein